MKEDFLSELKKDREYINKQQIKIVEVIMEICLKNIKILNSCGALNMKYEVPPFVLGHPIYDISNVSKKVNTKLKRLGLKTIYKAPNIIYISW